MKLSASDLQLSKNRPTKTKLDLFVFRPQTVMQCQINDPSIAKGERTILYDTVSTGSFSAVEADMTLLIGTVAGADDVGRIRIKSATSGQFTVSENSNINWQDRLHLTVLRYFEIWPVFPKIILQANDQVIFYKDYDIPHTTQNYILGTFVNAGPHRPVLLENGSGTAYYSSTGTYNLLEEGITFDWSFEGGNPTGSTSPEPGYVTYLTPGDYVTRLIVTSGSGAVDTTYRHIAVRDKIGEGSNTPIVRWKMGGLRGSRGEGGQSAEFTIYDVTHLEENAIIMLRADDWYGGTNRSLGGNYPNEEKIFFVGYVDAGSIHYNYKDSSISFTATSVTGIMKKTSGFSVSVESTSNPNTWFQLRDMDLRRAIYHYLRWHSTVLKSTDFNFVGQDQKIQYFDADRTSIFDSVDELLRGTLIGSLASDRQGRLWAEVDPQAYPDPTGTFIPVMEITRQDWKGEPDIADPINDFTSYIEVGGIAYSGAITGTFGAFLSGAPGLTPSFTGEVEQIPGLALAGQNQLNQLSGNIWANRNQLYPAISMEMSNPTRQLDIAPQEGVSIKVSPDDTIKNVSIDKIYIPKSITWSYDSLNEILVPEIEFKGVVTGIPGDTITISSDVGDDEFEFPDFSFPPFPPLTFPTLAIVNPLTISRVVILVKNSGIFYTDDFDADSPTWYSSNIGLPATSSIFAIESSVNGRLYCQIGTDSIWSSPTPGGVWSQVFEATEVGNPEGYPFPGAWGILGFGVNRFAEDELIIIGGLTVTIFGTCIIYPFYGSSSGVSITNSVHLTTPSKDRRYGRLVYNNGGWIMTFFFGVTNNPAVSLLSPNGSSISGILELAGGTVESIVATHSNDTLDTALAKNSSTTPYLTDDQGISWTPVSGTTPYIENDVIYGDRFESIIAGDGGQQMVVVNALGLKYSNDFGANWNNSIYTGSSTAVWHLGDDVYAFGGGNKIYAIQGLDIGAGILLDKTGNLPNIITGSFSVMAIRHYQDGQ